jgi:hypothetical protein
LVCGSSGFDFYKSTTELAREDLDDDCAESGSVEEISEGLYSVDEWEYGAVFGDSASSQVNRGKSLVTTHETKSNEASGQIKNAKKRIMKNV